MDHGREFIDVLLLCAVEMEMKALRNVFQDCSPKHIGTFPEWTYHKFVLPTESNSAYQVVIAQCRDDDNINAAILTQHALAHFAPQVALFVGIAGTLDKNVLALGSIAVVREVIYDKSVWVGECEEELFPQNRPKTFSMLIENWETSNDIDWQKEMPSGIERPAEKTPGQSDVKLARLAVSHYKIKDARRREELMRMASQAKIVAMEEYGFCRTCQINKELPRQVFRAIVDDTQDVNKDWQEYGAHAVAAFVKSFLKRGIPGYPPRSPDVQVQGVRAGVSRRIFKGLHSYDEEDHENFMEIVKIDSGTNWPEAISQMISQIATRKLYDRPFKVAYVVGPSGSGKTSLIRAGAVPILRRLGGIQIPNRIVASSIQGNTESQLRDRLQSLLQNVIIDSAAVDSTQGDTAGDPNCNSVALPELVRSVLDSIVNRDEGPQRAKAVFFFDQFEQWLQSNSLENSELVQALQEFDGLNLQAVLVLRKEFISEANAIIKKIKGGPHVAGYDAFEVEVLDTDQAMITLSRLGQGLGKVKPGNSSNTAFVEDSIENLKDTLGKVLPVKLATYVMMLQIKNSPWELGSGSEANSKTLLGVQVLDTFLGHEDANYHYLKYNARRLLKSLLRSDESPTKGEAKPLSSLRTAAACQEDDFQQLIELLDKKMFFITAVSSRNTSFAAGGREGDMLYQLTHDYLVPAIKEWDRNVAAPGSDEYYIRLFEDYTNSRDSSENTTLLPDLEHWKKFLQIVPPQRLRHSKMMIEATQVHASVLADKARFDAKETDAVLDLLGPDQIDLISGSLIQEFQKRKEQSKVADETYNLISVLTRLERK